MLDLAGEWRLALDPEDVGVVQKWHQHVFDQTVVLPGSLQAQGIGEDVTPDTEWVGSIFDDDWYVQERYAPYRRPGNVKVPFWLQPIKRYQGAAWYQREVHIPAEWEQKYVTLTLERAHWSTRVWLNGIEIGACDSLSTPHVYLLGQIGGGAHQLVIRVDNRVLHRVGPNAHSISDHTQTNWNGIVGGIGLAAHDAVQIAQIQVVPDVVDHALHLTLTIRNLNPPADDRVLSGILTLSALLENVAQSHSPDPISIPVSLHGSETRVALTFPLGDGAQEWDEFQPALYTVTALLEVHNGASMQSAGAQFRTGLREISTSGRHLMLNRKRIYLRGTLECCVFPRTGYPPTDIESWRRIVRICKEHGLNHIRFHSWCPPEAAFQAADELGIYIQIECAAWVNQGPGLGLGESVDTWLYAEGGRIVAAYGHHPSFILMAYGNEPGGNDVAWLGEWVAYWRQQDPSRLHTSGAGWPAIPANQYHNLPGPRLQQWGAQLNSRINALPPETCTTYADQVQDAIVPIVSHEIGQWCAYPNFDEISKYDGYLRAHNLEIFRDFLAQHHMADQARDFLMASGKLQVLCYKEEIEALLRTPDLGGFQLLDLHDFPGQGTALVGVLDAFWDAKPYVRAAEIRRFCNNVVLLVCLEKRYWYSGEELKVEVEVAHFGASALSDAQVVWRIAGADSRVAAEGNFSAGEIPASALSVVGKIATPLRDFTTGRKYTISIAIEGTEIENSWDIWLFADRLDTTAPDTIHVTESLDADALDKLRHGGKVLLALPAERVHVESEIGFSSVFWNTSWTKDKGHSTEWLKGQAPHTLGILCAPDHPVFAHFPTEYHSDWQWWELIHGSAAMVLEPLHATLRPLVQPIDTWFESRRLGLLLEAQVEGGSLMICSMDITSTLETRPVARQMRHSILRYMESTSFAPIDALTASEVRTLLAQPPSIQ